MNVTRPKHRLFQFSLRALLVIVTLCAVPCSWLAVKMQQAKRQRDAVTLIEKLGGWVEYDYQTDALGRVMLNRGAPVPTWLRNLLGDDFFGNVDGIGLDDTEVSDTDLEHLTPLIERLTRLRCVGLEGTKVTDDGVKKLQAALPKCMIYSGGRKRVLSSGRRI